LLSLSSSGGSEAAGGTAADHRKGRESSISFRGYDSQDASFVQGLGIATAFAAVIILCLYLQSDAVRLLYAQPRLLWLTIPLFTFWICRLWRVTVRGKMHADPVIYVLRDRQTYAFALVVAGLLMLAKPVVHAALMKPGLPSKLSLTAMIAVLLDRFGGARALEIRGAAPPAGWGRRLLRADGAQPG